MGKDEVTRLRPHSHLVRRGVTQPNLFLVAPRLYSSQYTMPPSSSTGFRKIKSALDGRRLVRYSSLHTVDSKACLEEISKLFSALVAPRRSDQSPRVTAWEGPGASVSQGHHLITSIPAFPLPSCCITCQFWLLRMFPGISNPVFLILFLQGEGLSCYRY